MKKLIFPFFLSLAVLLSACGPKIPQGNGMGLEKVIYHTGVCFGSCPQLDMQIDSLGNAFVKRQIYTGKVQLIEASSGNFSGKLTAAQLLELNTFINVLNPYNLKVDSVTCCDLPPKTLIVYGNGKRSYFKTLRPPAISLPLLAFLQKIALSPDFQKTGKTMDIEN